jgi:CRISPR-associated endonuclease Csn1
MRKALAAIHVNIEEFSRDDLDEIGYILTINTDKEAMMEAFDNSRLELPGEIKNAFTSGS